MSPRSQWQPDDAGFTIIEVLMTTVVLGFIASAVAGAIILFFRTQDGTSSRLSLSHDSQLLASYLVSDLDSLGHGQPVVTLSGSAACGPTFSDVQISFTGVVSSDTYQVDYTTSGTSIFRTFTHQPPSGPPTTTKTTVVHNLRHRLTEPGVACFSRVPGPAPWTMTVTVEAHTDPATDPGTDYTFSVTGGRATAAPVLCTSTCAQPGLLSKDTNGDGKIDQIVAAFDGPLVNGATPVSEWTISGLPAAMGLASATVSGNSVTLALSGNAPFDTVAAGLTVAFQPDPGGLGVRNAANQPAAGFGATGVTDGMAPLLTSIMSQDADADGRIDHVLLKFSETLQPLANYSAGTAPWQLLSPPSGVVVIGPDSITGNTVALQLKEGAAYDTLATGFRVAMAPLAGGLRDLAGNLASFPSTSVDDGMTPVATSLLSQDTDHNGRVDRVVITFSESLVGYAPVNPPWTLINPPAGVSLNTATVTLNSATLLLNEGTGIDTTATGFQISLAQDPNGVRDGVGHLASFTGRGVSDGMGPVVIGLSSTNSAMRGHDQGRLEPDDTVMLTFSEGLDPSSLPVAPVLQLVPGPGNDRLLIPGLATIDLGGTDLYVERQSSGATFASSLSSDGAAVITIVIGSNKSGAGTPQQADHPTDIVVRPLADSAGSLPKDLAGNVADGVFATLMVLF